jgi:Lon-like protease
LPNLPEQLLCLLSVRRQRGILGQVGSWAHLGYLSGLQIKAGMTFFQRRKTSSKSSERAKSAITFFTVVTFAAGFLTLALLPTPYLIERAGPTYDVLGEVDNEPVIQISGAQSYESEGMLEVLTVSIVGRPENTPSWIEIGLAWLDESQAVVPVELLYPDDRTTEEIRSESSAMMEVSQQDAIAAALNYLGYETPRQVYIAEVVADAAASGKLVAGDFVLSINSEPIIDLEQLKGIVTSWDEKAPLSVVVDRNGREVTKEVSPIKDAEGNFRLGILVGYKYDFPIEVNLQLGDVGGPSGGMMFALGIIDRLTPGDLTGGLHVAGTGTITQSGEVGPIGGVVQKLYGASRSGATVFLAPAANCDEIVGNVPDGLRVVKIETLQQALDALEKLSADEQVESLPSCTN